jgi:hypothetical protein
MTGSRFREILDECSKTNELCDYKSLLKQLEESEFQTSLVSLNENKIIVKSYLLALENENRYKFNLLRNNKKFILEWFKNYLNKEQNRILLDNFENAFNLLLELYVKSIRQKISFNIAADFIHSNKELYDYVVNYLG